jgi:hypothetical protein
MNQRQQFAFEHPLNDATLCDTGPYQQTRRHATGLLLLTILAIDR